MAKPETNISFFEKITGLLKEQGKITGRLGLEYVLPVSREEQILDYHFDVTFSL